MSKLNNPLMSLEAHGTVGNALTFQTSDRYKIVRQKPRLPYSLTLAQQYQRWLYEDYAYLWTQQSEATKAEYRTAGVRFHRTGYQQWISVMLATLPDIAGMWHFDKEAQAVASDTSRNANNGVVIGATSMKGLIAEARHLDGINDSVRVPDAPTLTCADGLTAMIFFQLDTLNVDHVIYDKGAWNAHGYMMTWLQAPQKIRVQVGDGGNWKNLDFNLPSPLDPHHVTLVATPSTTLDAVIDGVTRHSTPLLFDVGDSPWDLYFGRMATAGDKWHKGLIDHAIIFNRVLDATEILRHSLRRYH